MYHSTLKTQAGNDIISMLQETVSGNCEIISRTKMLSCGLLFYFAVKINTKEGKKRMLYKDWLNEWLENYIKPSSKERTYQMYVRMSTNHIAPKFGEWELSELTPMAVQKFITELLKSGNHKTGRGLSVNSVNVIIVIIQNSLSVAHLIGVANKYEMNKIKRPKIREKQIECFSPDEQRIIEKAVMSDKRTKMRGIVICLYTGLRIGELLALEWADIDFAKQELHVNKSCHDGKGENGKYIKIIESPKTDTSQRIIPIPKQVLPMLKDIKRDSTCAYIVSDGAKGISVRSYQRSFELLLKKLKIPHRGFHSLRHTFATRALECGVDVKTLSEILGHKNPTITLNRYAHSMMDHKREMMNRVGKLLS